MNKLNSIIYRLRNVLFLLFMVGLIRLIPNIKELEFIGTIFIIFVFIYLLLDLYFYGCKSKELNNNKFQNILVILLYIYVFIVSQRYINSINDFTYEVDNMYYLINYIIISLALICISINNFILLSIKKYFFNYFFYTYLYIHHIIL